ncbi:MAG: peptidyl-prolyl cis-trans isomerase [Candidatus Omnitrophica bacterium]|nr:peptidyl-prolyl cis-trans isomerase [Candidatus Omnitrophota bacterium]
MVFLLIFSILIGPALFGSPCRVLAEELRIVAVVNNEVITQAELDQALAPAYLQLQAVYEPEELARRAKEIREKILQQLIEEKLILQEAKNPHPVEVAKGKIGTPEPMRASETEVDEMISKTAAKFESPEAFEEAMSQQGITLEDLRLRFQDQILIQKLITREIRSRVNISPAEVTAYFDAHAQEFESPPAVQAAVILIRPKEDLNAASARDLANDLAKRIQGGEDFYDLAKRTSDGPNPKMGGRVGFIEKGKSLREVDEALFALKAGEVSPVIKTQGGFYLFKAESIRPARKKSLEEAQGEIHDRLFQEKVTARYREWIDRLKNSSYVTIK